VSAPTELADLFDDAERRHFGYPMTTYELLVDHYDPTYGDSGGMATEFRQCRTCFAIVPWTDSNRHAEWHDHRGEAT
jgi:hypothetical protein